MALVPVASFSIFQLMPMPLLRKEMGIQVELDSEDVVSHVFIVESTTVYRKSGARYDPPQLSAGLIPSGWLQKLDRQRA
jgi:hypothetical protein